jgi:hypothetical protein
MRRDATHPLGFGEGRSATERVKWFFFPRRESVREAGVSGEVSLSLFCGDPSEQEEEIGRLGRGGGEGNKESVRQTAKRGREREREKMVRKLLHQCDLYVCICTISERSNRRV